MLANTKYEAQGKCLGDEKGCWK